MNSVVPNRQPCAQLSSFNGWASSIFVLSVGQEKYYELLICVQEKHFQLHFRKKVKKNRENVSCRICMNRVFAIREYFLVYSECSHVF